MSEKLPERIKVRVIETRGPSSLVEWKIDGLPHRAYMQSDRIDSGKCSFSALAHALPHGLDPMTTDLVKLTKQLRLRDVWTQADFQKKSHAVIRSLLEAMEVK